MIDDDRRNEISKTLANKIVEISCHEMGSNNIDSVEGMVIILDSLSTSVVAIIKSGFFKGIQQDILKKLMESTKTKLELLNEEKI